MSPTVFALAAFLVVAGAVGVTGALLLWLVPGIRRERFVVTAGVPESRSILRWNPARTWWQRLVEQVGQWTGPRKATNISKQRQRLVQAGCHQPGAVAIFTGTKCVLTVALGSVYPLVGLVVDRALPNALPISLCLAYSGFFLPDFYIRRRVRSRQEKITNALPDVLDLLTICVEAGMGFDAALARVAELPEGRHSPLHQELMRMNLEMRAGRPRQEALRAFAGRCGVQDVNTVVSIFIQTDRLGTSMGKALRVHSDTARVQRRHRIEERAYVAPLKMMFPTIVFLVPAFALVAMAPSLLGVLNALQGTGK